MKYVLMMNILLELLNYGKRTAKELADKFEISTRSVIRYIEALDMAGVPICSIQGKNGGYKIMDTYRLTSSFMTDDEFKALINASEAVASQTQNKILYSGIEKLKSATKLEQSSLTLSSGNLIIDAGPWGGAIGYKAKIGAFQEAIEKNIVTEITYHNLSGDVSQRKIEPHTLVFKQGLWYVYAFCRLRNEFRLFKTGRIESANFTNERFERKHTANAIEEFDNWYKTVSTINIKFEVDKKILSDIEEWLGIENVKVEKNKITATANLPDDNGLIPKILSYGSGLKVVNPKSLIDKIKKDALSLIKNYD